MPLKDTELAFYEYLGLLWGWVRGLVCEGKPPFLLPLIVLQPNRWWAPVLRQDRGGRVSDKGLGIRMEGQRIGLDAALITEIASPIPGRNRC